MLVSWGGGLERHCLGHVGARISKWSDYVDLFVDYFFVVLQEGAKMMPKKINAVCVFEVVGIAQV